ncbi:MAG: ABC transporter permease [Armatimonadota bacterium]|nr:ABC transporter permease [Armatimonadota bacterium]
MSAAWRALWLPVAVFALAVVVAALVIALSGSPPLPALAAWWEGAVTAPGALPESLLNATPLLFTGLAVAVGLLAGQFNIGVEGQLLMGALASAWVGFSVSGLPAPLHLPLALLTGALVGALWGWIPGILKSWRGAHEVITTIMMNYIAIYLTQYLVTRVWKDPNSMSPQTPEALPSAWLPVLVEGTRLSAGLILALAVALAIWYALRRTVWGYELRATGANMEAARAAGVRVSRVVWGSMALSGAIGGLAGAVEVLGVHHRYYDQFSPGYGFDGIAVALLGNNHPLGVVLAALAFGAMKNGAVYMQSVTSPAVPREITLVVQAVVIFFLAAMRFRRRAG